MDNIEKNRQKETERKRKQRAELKKRGAVVCQVRIERDTLEIIDRFRGITNISRSEVIRTAIRTWAIDTAEAMPKLEEWAKTRGESKRNAN